jgi:hypothetical protein
MTRQEVFAAIESELDYQEARWGVNNDQGKPTESFLLYMRHYLDEAIKSISTERGDENARDIMRKVITIGVKAGIIHGLPFRTEHSTRQSSTLPEHQ